MVRITRNRARGSGHRLSAGRLAELGLAFTGCGQILSGRQPIVLILLVLSPAMAAHVINELARLFALPGCLDLGGMRLSLGFAGKGRGLPSPVKALHLRPSRWHVPALR